MGLYDLPGTHVEVSDGGMRVVAPAPNPKVTVLGVSTSTDLTVNEPYALNKVSDVQSLYNSDGTPSELAKACDEAFAGGAQNVEAVLISTNTGIDADARYVALEDTYDALLNHDVDIINVAGVGMDTALTGTGRNFGYQVAKFCYDSTINYRGVVSTIGVESPVSTLTGTPSLTEMNAWVNALYAFDTSGINGSDVSIYDGYNDANSDGVPDTYAFYATSDGVLPTGSPPSSDTQVTNDARGNPVDIGAYLSVTAMHNKQTGSVASDLYPTKGYYHSNGSAGYAGLISNTVFYEGTTNKIMPGITPSRKLSVTQLEKLRQARYVAITSKASGHRILDGLTGAYNVSRYYKSDFTKLSTVRIVHQTIAEIRNECDPFIGKPYNVANRNAMEERIDSVLADLIDIGALNGGDFRVIATSSMRSLGEVLIELTLDVAVEIDEITVRIGLVPPGTLAA